MLVVKTIKDPPDKEGGFEVAPYSTLCSLCDFEDTHWVVTRGVDVQITSQVERTEPDELVVEEHSDTDEGHDEDEHHKDAANYYDLREHTFMEGEVTEALGSDMECADDSTDVDTREVADTTGDNDQEDTSKNVEADRRQPNTEVEGLDIQFVRVITT